MKEKLPFILILNYCDCEDDVPFDRSPVEVSNSDVSTQFSIRTEDKLTCLNGPFGVSVSRSTQLLCFHLMSVLTVCPTQRQGNHGDNMFAAHLILNP